MLTSFSWLEAGDWSVKRMNGANMMIENTCTLLLPSQSEAKLFGDFRLEERKTKTIFLKRTKDRKRKKKKEKNERKKE